MIGIKSGMFKSDFRPTKKVLLARAVVKER